jgi:GntR family transcriptional regulator/MocR family aminotransferase
MEWSLVRERLAADGNDAPRYALIADMIQEAIVAGYLPAGTRLPTVRQLAQDLGVGLTTSVGAYKRLREGGWIQGEVGRGTFVANPTDSGRAGRAPATISPRANRLWGRRPPHSIIPWRRRALITSSSRLRASYPAAADCTSGRPDKGLLPLDVLKRAWGAAIAATTQAELQYSGPEPIDELTRQLLPRLAADGITAGGEDLVVGASAQQFMVLVPHILGMTAAAAKLVVAVEEPGYPTIFDAYERAGYALVGVEVDAQGAIPASLDAALAAGAQVVLFTPRAHNPTGASWTARRVADLADVLADHPEVVAIEDDQFAGIAVTRPGSLIADQRIGDRVVYVRSFSKSVAPDLRVAVAVAGPALRQRLAEAKSFADGWTSRLAQRALAAALADNAFDEAMAAASEAYAARRAAAAATLSAGLAEMGGGALPGDDGVNVWVHLPPDVDAAAVVERAAAMGVLVAPGEPFFIRPGRHDVLRMNAGSVTAEVAAAAGRIVSEAARSAVSTDADGFPV